MAFSKKYAFYRLDRLRQTYIHCLYGNILITNDTVIKPKVNNTNWCTKLCHISLEPFAKAQICDEMKVKELIEKGQLKDENITAFVIKIFLSSNVFNSILNPFSASNNEISL